MLWAPEMRSQYPLHFARDPFISPMLPVKGFIQVLVAIVRRRLLFFVQL